MATEKKTAPKAAQGVHTSVQTKPDAHQPSVPHPVDPFHGKAGRFVRDPQTGERKPVTEAGEQQPAADHPTE